MDAAKVKEALRACLEMTETSTHPVTETGLFFDELSKNPDWSPDEINELQTLFIQSIIHRWRGPDSRQ
ncbi:MAG: hypothetical protein IAF94_14600 [Pirellulaceae bacterium]|nr:hypothetical protein [Pirellulaceae bacterium]